MKFTIINYVWDALYLLIVRLSISPAKLTQKLTEKKTNSKSFFQGRCFHKNTLQKTLRGQSFHSASFLIDFLSKKASFFRPIFSISWHRERAASMSLICCERNYDIRYKKWNVNPHFSVEIILPLNFNLERDILILPKCNDNELVRNNSLSQLFSCFKTFGNFNALLVNTGVNYTCREKFYY